MSNKKKVYFYHILEIPTFGKYPLSPVLNFKRNYLQSHSNVFLNIQWMLDQKWKQENQQAEKSFNYRHLANSFTPALLEYVNDI